MSRYTQIATAIKTRIRHGDYRIRDFPTVIGLAEELRANPRTVGRALDELLKDGVLQRLESGRMAVSVTHHQKQTHVVFLAPAYPSMHLIQSYDAVQRLAKKRGWKLRSVNYVHWRDPVIDSCLRGFDAVMLFTGGNEDESQAAIPPVVVEAIQRSGRPVVVLCADSSAAGIPCVEMISPLGVRPLLDVLLKRGHRRVACFNAQPMSEHIRGRIDQWSLWAALNGIVPQLFDLPVQQGGSAMAHGYSTFCELLDRKQFDSTAVFCTTGPAAVGVMRALTDRGLEPGTDVSVCSADDVAGQARFLRPSLTCITDPDPTPYLEVCMDWFSRGGEWIGPLCIRPAEMPLFVGESTEGRSGTAIVSVAP